MEIFKKYVCHAFLCGEEYVVDRSLCHTAPIRTHARTHTQTHTNTHTHVHTHTYKHVRTHGHIRVHTHIHKRAHARPLTDMHTNILTPSFTVFNYVIKRRDETLSVTSPIGKCIQGHNNYTDTNS